jgi:hypothetical protein
MNRTTTVVVALIAAAGLSTMVYAVPEQRALAWGGFGGFGGFGGCGFGCGGGFFGGCGGFGGCGFGCGDGCGGGFFVHKTIIQTIHQVNNCTDKETHVTPPPPRCNKDCSGNDQNQNDNQDQNQKDKQVVCVNTATNTARHGFGGGFGFE